MGELVGKRIGDGVLGPLYLQQKAMENTTQNILLCAREGLYCRVARELSSLGATADDTCLLCIQMMDSGFTIGKLAEGCNSTRTTLKRRTRKFFECTPQEWLRGHRLLRAEQLLSTTQLSVKTIACSCGFGSPSLLCRHFRARYGTSPAEYRRNICSAPHADESVFWPVPTWNFTMW